MNMNILNDTHDADFFKDVVCRFLNSTSINEATEKVSSDHLKKCTTNATTSA